jgi:hypothetical protein
MNLMVALGTFSFSNGDRYEGNFHRDKKDGAGTYFHAKGDRYEGTWHDDKVEGT